jgi:hypothetical protein
LSHVDWRKPQSGDLSCRILVMPPSRIDAKLFAISVLDLFQVQLLVAIAAIWALGLLSLAFTLPIEFLSPPDSDDSATKSS